MTEPEVLEIVAMVVAGFPHGKLDAAGAKIYARMLVDLDAAPTKRAVIQLLRTAKFTPSIAEIRETSGAIRKDMADARAVRERRKALPMPYGDRVPSEVQNLLAKIGGGDEPIAPGAAQGSE